LAQAAAIYFGQGSGVTGRTLASQARRGHLAIFKIAGKSFTTIAAIRTMVENSSVHHQHPAPSISASVNAVEASAAVARAETAMHELSAVMIRERKSPRSARGRS
jgi:hypothetical protein